MQPISDLFQAYFGKILERCFVNRLVKFLDHFSLLSSFQFGFRKKLSTQNAIIDLMDQIHASLNEKMHHISVFIDLKKAFDTVNHEILLKKLDLYGVRGLGQNWVKSYLKDRRLYVGLGEYKSRVRTQNLGVVQGSIIGPILFLIYINDLPKISINTHTTLYADDTTITVKNNDFNQLIQDANAELVNVKQWTVSNRLTINEAKTEIILFSKRFIPPVHDPISIGGSQVDFINSCKFLKFLTILPFKDCHPQILFWSIKIF